MYRIQLHKYFIGLIECTINIKKAEKKEEGGKIDLLLVLFFTSAEKQASILASGIQIYVVCWGYIIVG